MSNPSNLPSVGVECWTLSVMIPPIHILLSLHYPNTCRGRLNSTLSHSRVDQTQNLKLMTFLSTIRTRMGLRPGILGIWDTLMSIKIIYLFFFYTKIIFFSELKLNINNYFLVYNLIINIYFSNLK